MAAFAVENANKTWMRVEAALAGANPGIKLQFKALKTFLATQKKNPDLQFFAYTGAQSVAAGGTLLGTGTGKVYGWYIKKVGTGTGNATDASIKLYDNATDDTTASGGIAVLVLLTANDEATLTNPAGIPLAAGLVITGHTTIVGSTDSAAGDGGSGFVIIGS